MCKRCEDATDVLLESIEEEHPNLDERLEALRVARKQVYSALEAVEEELDVDSDALDEDEDEDDEECG